MGKYWRVVCRYGHVGMGKEVSVIRYLQTPESYTAVEVMDLVATMPGVKKTNGPLSAIREIEPVSSETYHRNKKNETDNFYMQLLFYPKEKPTDKSKDKERKS